jgi:hypothetical protein
LAVNKLEPGNGIVETVAKSNRKNQELAILSNTSQIYLLKLGNTMQQHIDYYSGIQSTASFVVVELNTATTKFFYVLVTLLRGRTDNLALQIAA